MPRDEYVSGVSNGFDYLDRAIFKTSRLVGRNMNAPIANCHTKASLGVLLLRGTMRPDLRTLIGRSEVMVR